MVPRSRPKKSVVEPRAKPIVGRLPLPLSRALARFRAAEDDFEESCVEHGSLFRIDERYAVLVARATELLSRAPERASTPDDEACVAAARALAETLRTPRHPW